MACSRNIERGYAVETSRLGVVALAVLLFVVIVGGVFAYQRSQNEVVVDSPIRVETNKATGETTVDAPFAHVQKNQSGTHIRAPGVDVDVPNKPADK
jgi:hypothetical protein